MPICALALSARQAQRVLVGIQRPFVAPPVAQGGCEIDRRSRALRPQCHSGRVVGNCFVQLRRLTQVQGVGELVIGPKVGGVRPPDVPQHRQFRRGLHGHPVGIPQEVRRRLPRRRQFGHDTFQRLPIFRIDRLPSPLTPGGGIDRRQHVFQPGLGGGITTRSVHERHFEGGQEILLDGQRPLQHGPFGFVNWRCTDAKVIEVVQCLPNGGIGLWRA